jgi:hypothetical protein
VDDVVTALRRRDLMSLTVAGRIHELGQAVKRAETTGRGQAMLILPTPRCMRWSRRSVGWPGRSDAMAAGHEGSDPAVRPKERPTPAPGGRRPTRRFRRERTRPLAPRRAARAAAGVVAGVLLVAAVLLVLLLGRSSDMEQGVAAFRDGRDGVAEQHFRAVLQRDDGNVTARLYLARILRRQDRTQEAAELLRLAAGWLRGTRPCAGSWATCCCR